MTSFLYDSSITDKIKANKDLAIEAFIYELGNHEYCITYDLEPTLSSLGLDFKDLEENAELQSWMIEARRTYLNGCDY